ncbi:protein kinase [Streptomyces sp. NPDC052042]|uniref:serine/threonine-protein kinase n=1 Tax=Streptomyces sp. NPDC052042 TaxID=3365683 RepID=UPI0037D3AF4A
MTQEAQPDQVIDGRYRLIAKLGAGGFGEVWKAHDETLRIDVAVKAVRVPPAALAEEQAERLIRAAREARNAARLRDHPNIVAVHDVVVHRGVPWTVMQLVVGASLQEHLDAHGPLPVNSAETLASALLSALGAAHNAGIVHRDVKPANVMLAGDQMLLTDFGIAVHQQDTALTGTGMLIGSAEYMAPERVRGKDGVPASDLFSLGVTLYQAIEGVSPFRRSTFEASLSAVLFDDPPQSQHAGRLTELITRLLNKVPDQRPTVVQAQALLSAARDHTPPPPGSENGVRHQPPGPTGDRRQRAAAALTTAEHLARRFTTDGNKAWALCRIAQVEASIDPDRARQLADEAERTVRGLPDGEEDAHAMVLAWVANSLASIDPDRARQLADEAERTVRGLPDGEEDAHAMVLAWVANSLASIDPDRARQLADEAERLARESSDSAFMRMALGRVADTLVTVEPARAQQLRTEAMQVTSTPFPGKPKRAPRGASFSSEAERRARATFGRFNRVRALVKVARQLAETDPVRAGQVTGEAERTAQTIYFNWRRAGAYAKLGEAQAQIAQELAAEDPDEAMTLVDKARTHLEGHYTDPRQLQIVKALAAIAEAVASTDPDRARTFVDEAERLAHDISDGNWRDLALEHIVEALTGVGEGLAVIDPDRARLVLREAERAIRNLPHDARSSPQEAVVEGLAHIARGLAAEDPDRARTFADEAERLAHDISEDIWRDLALEQIVEALTSISTTLMSSPQEQT